MNDHEGRLIPSRMSRRALLELGAAAVAAPAFAAVINAEPAEAAEDDDPQPKVKVDADWPKPLPDVLRPGESFRRT